MQYISAPYEFVLVLKVQYRLISKTNTNGINILLMRLISTNLNAMVMKRLIIRPVNSAAAQMCELYN